jgi:hypothetical protein
VPFELIVYYYYYYHYLLHCLCAYNFNSANIILIYEDWGLPGCYAEHQVYWFLCVKGSTMYPISLFETSAVNNPDTEPNNAEDLNWIFSANTFKPHIWHRFIFFFLYSFIFMLFFLTVPSFLSFFLLPVFSCLYSILQGDMGAQEILRYITNHPQLQYNYMMKTKAVRRNANGWNLQMLHEYT